jgi:NAD(P)-dependent dehydrogenase (short-subunit alcohol dehydrogenase family)
MKPNFSVEGRVALVTGGSSGIGLRFVQAYLEAKAKVVAVSRSAGPLAKLQSSFPDQLVHVVADLSKQESAQATVAAAIDAFGQVDILVNAAGVNPRQNSSDLSLDDWNMTVNLNLTAPYLLAKGVSTGMRERGWGRIINIASLQSERAFPNGIAYGATKGGITQLTRAMAEEWSSDGVGVNAIGPGFFPTALTQRVFENGDLVDQLAAQTCIGRNGKLDDLVGPLMFLSSPASDYVTGQILFVDGGFTAK